MVINPNKKVLELPIAKLRRTKAVFRTRQGGVSTNAFLLGAGNQNMGRERVINPYKSIRTATKLNYGE